MFLYLHPHLKSYFSCDTPLFDQIMSLKGEIVRKQKNRITQKIYLGNQAYFIKQYYGAGWKEIFKNILQLRWPILNAKHEWLALKRLPSLNISSPVILGYGLRGINPARQESFLLMTEITHNMSLEQYTHNWIQFPPSFSVKHTLIKEVAHIVSQLHRHGINHRDCYICHFLLNIATESSLLDTTSFKITLIDLHRAQIRSSVPLRWIIKDLSGLYFSTVRIGLTKHDYYRFMKYYSSHLSLRDLLHQKNFFWKKIKKTGDKLTEKLL